MGELIDAVKRNDTQGVKRLIGLGIDLDSQDNAGNTALMHACVKLNEAICHDLIVAGANVNLPDINDYAPLHEALRFPDFIFGDGTFDPQYELRTRIVKKLCDAGADINAESCDGTPLNIAIETRNASAVLLLSERGATLNNSYTSTRGQYRFESAALWLTSEHLNKALEEILPWCREGIDNLFSADFAGETHGLNLTTYAAQFGNLGAIRMLVDMTHNPDFPNMYGATPLMIAISAGQLGAADYLVRLGADKYARDYDRWGVYEHAMIWYRYSGQTDALDWVNANT